MFRSYRVGSVFGIPIKLDVTLLIILPIFAWIVGSQVAEIVAVLEVTLGTSIDPDPLTSGPWPWIVGALAAVGLFVCVALHELGHSVVAIRYGYEIDSITLWLLGGVAQFTEQPRAWSHEFWIAIAGPVVSVAVGAVCYAAVLVLPVQFDAAIFVLGYLAVLNVVLAAFNMLPAFPLDGGRVLRALFTRTRPFVEATQWAVRIGKVFAVLLGLFGLLTFNVFLIAIAFFVYIVGAAEGRQTMLASVFEEIPVGRVMTPYSEVVTVAPELRVPELLDHMLNHRYSGYPVVGDGDVVGMVTIGDIRTVPPDQRADLLVADVMSTDLKTVSVDDDLMDAFGELARNDVGRLLVNDADGDVVGILTRTDLVRAFEVSRERQLEARERFVAESTGENVF